MSADPLPIDPTATYWSLVVDAATTHPDRVVLGDEHGRTLTNGELAAAAESAAAGLGLGPDDVVSWQLPSVLEAFVLMVACARVGAVQNPVLPILRERELRHIVAMAGTTRLIVPRTWRGFDHAGLAREIADEVGAAVIDVDLETGSTGALRWPTDDPAVLPAAPTDADACRWIYATSGTTSMPKGVRHSDASLVASSASMTDRLRIADGDVYPIGWPISHIGGVTMLASVLRAGGRLVLFESFDPATVAERMAAFGPTMLGTGVPFFRAYIDGQRAHGAEPLFPRLRTFVAGGAPTPPEIIDELRDVFGNDRVVNSYGLTEFPIAACPSPSDPSDVLRRTVGPMSPGVEVRFVDDEIRLRGPQCFLGYAGASSASASGGASGGASDEALDEEGWFRTGDLGRLDDDGFLFVTGRLKDVIIRNGENVSAQEVEEVLLRSPDVVDVSVIGIPDARTGERVCAVVVTAPGVTLDADALVAHCRSEGMANQKIPERFEELDVIERNPMGKVVKDDLRRRILAG